MRPLHPIWTVPALCGLAGLPACSHEKPQRAVDAGTDASLPSDAGINLADGKIIELRRTCEKGVELELMLLDDGTLRLHFVRNGMPQAERGYTHSLQAFTGPSVAWTHDMSSDELVVRTAELELRVAPNTCEPNVKDLDGSTVWSTVGAFRSSQENVSITRGLATGERIFGLGERTGAADRRGRILTNWTSDPVLSDASRRYAPGVDPLYQAHPFFISVLDGKVSGAYLANTHRTVFDVGKTNKDALNLEAAGGDIDLFVINGRSPARVLERYTQLVGRAPLPPRWTLGYHQSRWSYTPAARVEQIGRELRDRKLPADGLWLDIDHMDDFRAFTWHPTDFPEPRQLVNKLDSMGFKLTAILDPGLAYDVDTGYGALERGLARDVFIHDKDNTLLQQACWPGAAVFPDFSRADTRAWWGEELGRFYADSGVVGSWLDMNEPDVFNVGGFPSDVTVDGDGTGTTMAELRNVYALLMAKASYAGALKQFPNRRPFLLTRAGFSGVHQYAAVWTGDNESEWETLAMLPAQLQGMSLSALSFVGSDVGGFTSGAKTSEMYARWFELGAFSPFFRSHVMRDAPDQEPWSFGPEVEAAARKLLRLRYSLLPYWYQSFVEASEHGVPPIRPLWWDDLTDEECFAHEDEFFVGPSLLVALVTSPGVTERKVYLPKGNWLEFASGAVHEGPTELSVLVPWGSVPIFVRNGSIVPTQSDRQFLDDEVEETLYLDLFVADAEASTQLSLYEDDGATQAYREGGFSRTHLELEANAQEVRFDIGERAGKYAPPARALSVRLHGKRKRPSAATIDGKTWPFAWSESEYVASVSLDDDGLAHAIRFAP